MLSGCQKFRNSFESVAVMSNATVTGLPEIMANLSKAIKGIKSNGEAGLIEAGALVRAEGQRQTPVGLTSNLINSWYGPTPFAVGGMPTVVIGLTAGYAVFVHEMVDAHFKKPGAKAKFLEDPLKSLEGRMTSTLHKKMEIK